MEKIGKYVIESKLGQGGMGIVYKCLDPETGRHTAVKVLPQQMTASPSFLQRFKREVLTLQRLDHPNIVRIYDDGEWEGAYYYAMEYVEGVGLDSILADKERMPPLEALHIIRACAEALQHSHARAVIHRDIKPANIMITSDGGVKLMDFGIAKVLDATRMTETLSVLGTVEYMSPEQSQGRYVDAHSDLYSLGVVLYQCLTARVPISGTTPTEVIMKLRTHQIEPPSAWTPGLPKSLDALVMHLLERDTSKRLASAAELHPRDRTRRAPHQGRRHRPWADRFGRPPAAHRADRDAALAESVGDRVPGARGGHRTLDCVASGPASTGCRGGAGAGASPAGGDHGLGQKGAGGQEVRLCRGPVPSAHEVLARNEGGAAGAGAAQDNPGGPRRASRAAECAEPGSGETVPRAMTPPRVFSCVNWRTNLRN